MCLAGAACSALIGKMELNHSLVIQGGFCFPAFCLYLPLPPPPAPSSRASTLHCSPPSAAPRLIEDLGPNSLRPVHGWGHTERSSNAEMLPVGRAGHRGMGDAEGHGLLGATGG